MIYMKIGPKLLSIGWIGFDLSFLYLFRGLIVIGVEKTENVAIFEIINLTFIRCM